MIHKWGNNMKFNIDFLTLFIKIFSDYGLMYSKDGYLNLYNSISGLNLFFEIDLERNLILIRLDSCLCECDNCVYCKECVGSFEYELSKVEFYNLLELLVVPNYKSNFMRASEFYNIFLIEELNLFMYAFVKQLQLLDFNVSIKK